MGSSDLEVIFLWALTALLGFGGLATLLEKPNEIKEPEDNSIPLILYIRSFKEDDDDSDGLGHIENRLYNSFKNIGSVTAIGKPGRFEKKRRIYKYYFDDNIWKEKAKELMEKSYLIILKPSIADGLLWEFRQVVEHHYLNKLILIARVGNTRDKKLDEVRYNNYKRYVESQDVRFKDLLPEFNATKSIIYYANNTPISVLSYRNVPRYLIKYFRYMTTPEKRKKRRRSQLIIFGIIGLLVGNFLTASAGYVLFIGLLTSLLAYLFPTNTIGCRQRPSRRRKPG